MMSGEAVCPVTLRLIDFVPVFTSGYGVRGCAAELSSGRVGPEYVDEAHVSLRCAVPRSRDRRLQASRVVRAEWGGARVDG